jgi:hypothetical protein
MLVRSLGVPLVFVMCVLYIFTIIGLNVFIGQFHRCSDPTLNQAQCVGNGLQWLNSAHNFDWVGSGFLTVVSLTSKDSWAKIMYDGLSSTGPSTGPTERSQQPLLVFYLGVVLFWWILMSNIFIGVLMKAYNEGVAEFRRNELFDLKSSQVMHAQIGGSKISQRAKSRMLREGEQSESAEPQRHARVRRKDLPKIHDGPANSIRNCSLIISYSKVFDFAMHTATAACTVVYCFQTRVASLVQRVVLSVSDPLFLFLFGVETLLRMHGRYPRGYFLSTWDTLNGVMVVLSLLDYSLSRLLSGTEYAQLIGWHPQIVRSLQLLRAIQLMGRSRAVNVILQGIVRSVRELLSLAVFVSILAVSLATMTVQLFAGLCARGDDDEATYGVRCLLTDPARLLPPNKNFRCAAVFSAHAPSSPCCGAADQRRSTGRASAGREG